MRRRFMNSHYTLDYSKYMTIEALEDGYSVYINERDVEYNLNGRGWATLKAGFTSPTLKKGDLLSFRCLLEKGDLFGSFISNNKAINLRGNVLSLIFKDDISLDISDYVGVFRDTFSGFFNNIVNVENTFLPATTLAAGCYSNMFRACTSLVNAPELPATKLATSCYSSMFYGCTSLNYIKMMATDISASNCMSYWVANVSPTGTFVKNKNATWNVVGKDGVPSGWTIIKE